MSVCLLTMTGVKIYIYLQIHADGNEIRVGSLGLNNIFLTGCMFGMVTLVGLGLSQMLDKDEGQVMD